MKNHPSRNTAYVVISILLAVLSAMPPAVGQDSKTSFKNAKTVARDGGVMRPNPMAKLQALESALGTEAIPWSEVLNRTEVNIDPDTVHDTQVAIPALLGFRICDGIMAIKARDAEKLNACANHIEKMGKRLGVTDDDLKRAKMVRSFANRGEWGRVFLELGYLQSDIETVLQRESGKDGRAPVTRILYAAGWLQAARYTSGLVRDHYNASTGGILREPLLVKELKDDLDSAGLPQSGIIGLMSEAMGKLQQLVTVDLHQPLPKDRVEAMAKLTEQTVAACLRKATGSSARPSETNGDSAPPPTSASIHPSPGNRLTAYLKPLLIITGVGMLSLILLYRYFVVRSRRR